MTNSEQLTFITNANDLFTVEAAVRDVRAAFGETVRIVELQVKTSPTKLVYVDGEVFDATGMTLTVIYDDGSRDEVTSGYTLPTAPLKAGQQTVTFSYAGVSKTISVTVNRNPNADPTPVDPTDPTDPTHPTDPTTPDEPKKSHTALIVTLSVVGGVVVLGGAGFGVYRFMAGRKKPHGDASDGTDTDAGDAPSDGDGDDSDGSDTTR